MSSELDPSVADTLTSQAEAAAPELVAAPGERYHLERLLAQGGQAQVYVAFDSVLGREVAFKTPRPDADGQVAATTEARFLREARITARLDHPNVITVHEIGRLPDGRRFCTMRLVHGEGGGAPQTLGHALREARTLRARLALLPRFLDVCNGVAHAHARGVVHRDLKPDNVVLGGPGETVVLDWGLARERSDDDVADPSSSDSGLQTVDGHVFGTPLYMSPEQAHGRRDEVDERSDVWSLGVMLFEVLTGTVPLSGRSIPETIHAVRTAPVPEASSLEPRAPPALAAVVRRALSRDRAQRYASAAELATDVRAFLENRQVGVYDYSLPELVRLFVQRYRTAATVGTVSLVLLLVAFSAVVVSNRTARTSLAEAFVEKGRLAEASLHWDEAAVWYAAALEQTHRPDAAFGLRLAWERAGGQQVKRLLGSTMGVRALAASADGRWLVAGGTDRVLRAWDLRTARLERQLEGHGDAITGVAFSAADGALYSVSDDATVRRWWLDEGRSEVLATFPDSLNGVAVSPDGQSVAVAGENGEVALVDVGSGARRVVGRHDHPVYALGFRPDGKVLTSGSWMGQTRHWNVATGELLETLEMHSGSVLAVAWSPDGTQLATAGRDTTVRVVWASATGPDRVRVLSGHQQKVYALAWSADGELLVSAGSDGTVRVWQGRSGAPERGLSLGQLSALSALTFIPGRLTLASAGADGVVSLRELQRPPAPLSSWELQTMRRLPTGQLVVPLPRGFALVEPGTLRQTPHTFDQSDAQGGLIPSARLAVNRAGSLVVGSCGNRCIAWWDLPESRLIDRSFLEDLGVRGMVTEGLDFSPDDRLLATAGRDSVVRVWDTATRQVVRTLTAHRDGTYGVAFSPDGRLLATSGYDKQLIVWETAGFTEVRRLVGHEHGVRTLAFSPDGRRLASASWDRTARVWDVASGAELAKYRHQDFVFGLDWSDDGSMLATGSHDGTVRLWDTATHREALRFLSDEARVTAVRFVSGSRAVAYAGRGLHRLDLESSAPLPSLDEVLDKTGFSLEGLALEPRAAQPSSQASSSSR